MGGSVRKPYLMLAGAPILGRTLAVFAQSGFFEEIIVVVAATDREYCRRQVVEGLQTKQAIRIIAGGRERQESVFKALEASSGQDDDVVLIHDGVRPFVSADDLARCLEAVERHGACIAAVPASDTLKAVDPDGCVARTLPRETIWQAQTPQGFRLGLIREAHRRAREDAFVGTDDAQLVERLGHTVRIVPGSRVNIKITTPEDLPLAEAILRHARNVSQRG